MPMVTPVALHTDSNMSTTPYVFISYPRPLLGEGFGERDGWPVRFRKNFETKLLNACGRDIGTWMDDKSLNKALSIKEEIVSKAKDAMAFVFVLNNYSAASPHCMDELRSFIHAKENNSNRLFFVAVANPEDVKKKDTTDPLIKTILKDRSPYAFWHFNQQTEVVRPLEESDFNYGDEMGKLVKHLEEILPSPEPKKKIYIKGDDPDHIIVNKVREIMSKKYAPLSSLDLAATTSVVDPKRELEEIVSSSMLIVLIDKGDTSRIADALNGYVAAFVPEDKPAPISILYSMPDKCQTVKEIVHPKISNRIKFEYPATGDLETDFYVLVTELSV